MTKYLEPEIELTDDDDLSGWFTLGTELTMGELRAVVWDMTVRARQQKSENESDDQVPRV